jgi:hypothetical protein
MRNGIAGTYLIALSMIAGCAAPTTRPASVNDQATAAEAVKQNDLAAHDLVEKQKRASRVTRTLATRAQDMCGDHVGPDTGIYALAKFKGDLGEAMERNYGIREQLTILFILEGSPGEAAGLKARDVIKKVNDMPTAGVRGVSALHQKLPPDAPIVYEIERDGTPLSITVQPGRACRFPVFIVPSQAVNAFADGKAILVTKGMVNFVTDDRELALVIAHEMAHNTMSHLEAKKQNAGLGMAGDFAILLLSRGQVSTRGALSQAMASAYSQEFEAEADYVGLYIMANAGFPIDEAPLFWRRMAAAHPGSIKANHAASHPSTAYRMVALENAVKEIDAKRAANVALRPNMKDGHVAPSVAASTQ